MALLPLPYAVEANGVLPPFAGWTSSEIGSPSSTATEPGGSSGPVLTLQSDAAGFSPSGDAIALVHPSAEPGAGNADVRLKLVAPPVPNSGLDPDETEAGLLVLGDASDGAPFLFFGVNGDGQGVIRRRSVRNGAIAILPASNLVGDTLRVVAGFDTVYLYRSTDGGLSWIPMGGYPVSFEDFEPLAGTTVVQGTAEIRDLSSFRIPLFFEITKDEDEATFIGGWDPDESADAWEGDHLLSRQDPGSAPSAAFDLTPPLSGAYEIFLRWIPNSSASEETPVNVVHSSLEHRGFLLNEPLALDQTGGGGLWVSLGNYWLDRNTFGQQLTVLGAPSNVEGIPAPVSLDAVRLVKGHAPEPVVWENLEYATTDYSGEMSGSSVRSILLRDPYGDGPIDEGIEFDGNGPYVAIGPARADATRSLYGDGIFQFSAWGHREVRLSDPTTNNVFQFPTNIPYGDDKLSFQRSGGTLRLLRNGTPVSTFADAGTAPLLIDASFPISWGSPGQLGTGIDDALLVGGIQFGDADEDGLPDGWEFRIVMHGNAPASGIYSIIDVRDEDDYDGDGRTNAQELRDWSDPTDPGDAWAFRPAQFDTSDGTFDDLNTEAGGSGLRRVRTGSGWDAQGKERRILAGDGAFQFTVSGSAKPLVVGLESAVAPVSPLEPELWTLEFLATGDVVAATGGTAPSDFETIGSFEAGDRFMVARRSDQIEYWKNGALMASYPMEPSAASEELSAFARIHQTSDDAALSGAVVAGGVLPRDGDEDGLFDEFETGIVEADANDPFAGPEDIRPGDDFDGDSHSNFREQHHRSDPTNGSDRPVSVNALWHDSQGIEETETFGALGIRKFQPTDQWDSLAFGKERIAFHTSVLTGQPAMLAFTVGAPGNYAMGLSNEDNIVFGSPQYLDFGLAFSSDGTFAFTAGDTLAGTGGGTRSTSEIVGENRFEEGDRFEIRLTVTWEEGSEGSIEVSRFEVFRNGAHVGSRVSSASYRYGAVAVFRSPSSRPSLWEIGMKGAFSPQDMDADGLPDIWEMLISNFSHTDSINGYLDVLPGDDFDGDGRSNLTEFLDGSDPTNAADYRSFEPVFWTAMQFTDEAEYAGYPRSALRKVTGGSQWPGGALSRQIIDPSEGGAVRFRVEQLGDFKAGLVPPDKREGWAALDFFIDFYSSGTFEVMRGSDVEGLAHGVVKSYKPGDRFMIDTRPHSPTQTRVRIRRNDETIYDRISTALPASSFGARLTAESSIPAISEANISTAEMENPAVTDADGDGLPDDWELSRFVNVPGSGFASIHDVRGSDDSDQDGRTNYQEFLDLSDPLDLLNAKQWRPVKWAFHFLHHSHAVEDGYTSEAADDPRRSTLRSTQPVSGDWSSRAFGDRVVEGDGGIRFRVDQTLGMLIGHHRADKISGPPALSTQLNHHLYFRTNGTFEVLRTLTRVFPAVGHFAYYQPGDEFAIERRGALVSVWQNGAKLFSFAAGTSEPLRGRVFISNPGSSPQISAVREYGAILQDDLDEDGLPDLWEQQIIDAAPSDSVTSIYDVRLDDDYDGDGASNVSEFRDKTDPTDPIDRFVPVAWKEESNIEASYPSAGSTPEFGSSLTKFGGTEAWGSSTAVSSHALLGDGVFEFSLLGLGTTFRINLYQTSDPTKTPRVSLNFERTPEATSRLSIVRSPELSGESPTIDGILETDTIIVSRTGTAIQIRRRGRQSTSSQFPVQLTEISPLGDLSLHVDLQSKDSGIRNVRSRGFFDPLDRDGDGIPDADELTFIDSDPEDGYGTYADVDLDSDIDGDGRTAGEDLRFGPNHFTKHPDFRLGSNGRTTQVDLPTDVSNDPIRSLAGAFSVDQGGAATYSVPIPLPPGTAGMAPSLSLGYSSHAGNGVLGVGWSLAGLSAITRGGADMLRDGFHDPLDGDAHDRFYFGPSRLVLVSGEYGADGSEYRTENDQFSRFVFRSPGTGGGSWQVLDRSGLVLSFGTTPDSSIRREIGNTPLAVAWSLQRVEDRSGNYYEVTYSVERDGEHATEFVPAQIRYTGNHHAGVEPYTTVSFLYEQRQHDPFEGYFAPSRSPKKVTRKQRLREIEVKTGNRVNRRLVFDYEASPGTAESRLVSVREHAHDGSTYAPTRFEWEPVQAGWSHSPAWSSTPLSHPTFGDKGRQLVDLNGDSLPDLVGSHAVNSYTSDLVVALNNGGGFDPSSAYALPTGVFLSSESPTPGSPNSIEFGGTGAMFVDLNGDALPDLVSNGRFHWNFRYTKNETMWSLPENKRNHSTWPKKVHQQAKTYTWWEPTVVAGRYVGWTPWSFPAPKSKKNAKGEWIPSKYPPCQNLTYPITYHRVEYKENAKGVWLNTGEGWVSSPEYGAIADPQSPLHLLLGDSEKPDLGVRFVDLDKDGLMDLVQARQDENGAQIRKVFRNTGNGWEDVSGGAWDLPTPLAKGDGSKSQGCQFIDMNGDGLVDLVRGLATGGSYGSHTFESDIWLNTGSGWSHASWKLPTWLADHTGELCGRVLQDLNGDGLPDFILSIDGYLLERPFGGHSQVWLNTGHGWETSHSYTLPRPLVNIEQNGTSRPLGRMLSDVNGDGLVDFVSVAPASDHDPQSLRGVWLNTGRGWAPKDSRWNIPDGFTLDAAGHLAGKSSSFQLVDIDGDGYPDFIDRAGANQNLWGVWLNRASPERIGRFLAPLADPIRVSYTRMNDKSPQPETRKPVHGMGLHARYPHVDTQTPLALVSKVTRTDDRSREHSIAYSYGGLRFDQRGRGSQGFRWMETTDLLRGFSTYTEFLQDYPYTGLVSFSEKRLPDGRPLSRTRNHYAELPEKGGLPGGGGAVVRPYLRSSVASTFTVDSAGAEHYHMGTVRTVSELDEWGNVRSTRVDLHTTPDPEASPPLKSTTTVNEYGQENPAAWLIGRVTRSTVTIVSNEPDLVGPATVSRASATEYHPLTGLPVAQTSLPGSSLSSRVEMERDLFGNVRKTVKSAAGDPRRIVNEVHYDRTGRFAERTVNALGHSTSTKFDFERGIPLYAIDANGLRTDFDHDVWDDLVRTRFADGTASLSVRKWLNHSRIPGAVYYSYRQSSGTTPAVAYHDRYGRVLLAETIGFQGSSSNYAETLYDRHGRVQAVSAPYVGNASRKYWKTTRYDLLDRVVEVRAPDGRTTTTSSYGFATVSVNPLGQTSRTVADWFGRTVSATDAVGGTTRFRHDIDGNVARTTDVSGNVIAAEFNLLGLRTSMSDPHAGSTTTTYNGFGEVLTTADNLGNETAFSYDLLGRVAARTTPEAETVYTYDSGTGKGLGKLHRIDLSPLGGGGGWHHPHGSGYAEVHAYDSLGRSIGTAFTIEGVPYTTSQTYDALGRPDVSTDAGGFATRVNYNANGHAYETVRPDTGALLSRTEFVDAQGRTVSSVAGNGVETYRSFNPLTGFLNYSSTTKSNETGTFITPIQRFSYQYDDLGNLLSRADDRLSGTDPAETFSYDALNRLTTATVAGGSSETFAYTENGAGNFASRGGVAEYRYADSAHPHRLTTALDSAGTERAYTYDARGRILAETRAVGGGSPVPWRDYSWTSFGMPRVVQHHRSPVLAEGRVGGFPTTRGLAQARFTYDANFSRTTQIVLKGGRIVKTLYLGSLEIVETREYESGSDFGEMPLLERERKHHFGGGVHRVVETSDDGGITTTTVADTLHFHADRLGSVTSVTDGAGELVERLSFDSYGGRRTAADWSPEPGDGDSSATAKTTGATTTRGYTGHEQLDHFGLVHMNGRIYDAEIGRFLSPDPLISRPGNSQDYNRYTYALNNPHLYTDPSGYSEIYAGTLPPETVVALPPPKFPSVFNPPPTGPWANGSSWEGLGPLSVAGGQGFNSGLGHSMNYYGISNAAMAWAMLQQAQTEQARQFAIALAQEDKARFIREFQQSLKDYYKARREVLMIPSNDVSFTANGFIASSNDTTGYVPVVHQQPDKSVGIEMLKGLGEGLAQGALNIVNGLQDSAIGTVNLAIHTSPIYLGYRTLGGDPFSIASPDWSRSLVMEESDFGHNFSKISGALGVELLAGSKGAGLFGAAKTTWPAASGGRQVVNGIEYTTHALERMSPVGLIQKGTDVVSRGVPPSVVENAIKFGKVSPGNSAAEVVRTYDNVRVITNPEGTRVISVIKTGH